MTNILFNSNKTISVHFIGIGGIGMSGLAEVLHSFGVIVSGSDASSSDNTEKLKKMGITIFIGHKSENIKNQGLVVYSSAIKENNPEIIAAKENNIPIVRRAEILGDIMRLKYGLAVAGTHGKTTTTSCLATILEASKLDPTFIIGGIPKNLSGHAKVGKGDYVVAEADESDGSFLLLNPIYSVITNIDNDHMDHYGSEENLLKSFVDFANKVPFYGRCSINQNDYNLMKLRSLIKRPCVTFGIEEKNLPCADYEAINVVLEPQKSEFDLFYEGKKELRFSVNLPGNHNVLNALGAITVAHGIGLDFETIANSLQKFDGVGRRFQIVYQNDNFEVVDDYGHHPTEILKTLETAKKTRPHKKITVLFEPHRFTRTRDCWEQFVQCFDYADELFLCPIYPASEQPIDGINSENLIKEINKRKANFSKLIDLNGEGKNFFQSRQKNNEIIIALGAGSIGKKVRELVKEI